ncbi:hypothetical protein QCA50_010760 [Cerrena zonata]|uniref:Uncharacterized protein n=1 Tax=Cerrena zonata TaxID=2478898 RepID=A0AAW0FXL0_9APHY
MSSSRSYHAIYRSASGEQIKLSYSLSAAVVTMRPTALTKKTRNPQQSFVLDPYDLTVVS